MNKFNRTTIVIIHFLIWAVLFSLPYLLITETDTAELQRATIRAWTPLFLFSIVFYVNYLYLIEKFLFQKKQFLFIGINILVFVLLVLLKQNLLPPDLFKVGGPPPYTERMPPPKKIFIYPPKKFFIYFDTLLFTIPLIFSIALKMGERWIRIENDKKEAQNIKLQAEIQHLKYQLQPHFFFNSLNNIYSLVDIAPEKAKEAIHSLGKLMRYHLHESNSETVELKREVEFLKKYIELMKLRSSENVSVESNFPEISSTIKVKPLMFVSLIENAFKHGVSATEKSDITFSMTVENGVINFYSRNHNFAKSEEDKSGSGIGLENLKKRLLLLYKDKHFFMTKEKKGEFFVNLTIDTND